MFLNLNRLKRNDGFTLVELMVVVAILGVLASIAIPNYNGFQARARNTEGKIMIANAYTALHSYFAAEGTFTGCLTNAGYAPDLNMRRYFTVGISPISNANCGPNGGQACTGYGWNAGGTPKVSCTAGQNVNYYVRNAQIRTSAAILTDGSDLSGSYVTQTDFAIGAFGQIGLTGVAEFKFPSFIPEAYADGRQDSRVGADYERKVMTIRPGKRFFQK